MKSFRKLFGNMGISKMNLNVRNTSLGSRKKLLLPMKVLEYQFRLFSHYGDASNGLMELLASESVI